MAPQVQTGINHASTDLYKSWIYILDSSSSRFQENFLRLNVYYEDLNLQSFTERKAMTVGSNRLKNELHLELLLALSRSGNIMSK